MARIEFAALANVVDTDEQRACVSVALFLQVISEAASSRVSSKMQDELHSLRTEDVSLGNAA